MLMSGCPAKCWMHWRFMRQPASCKTNSRLQKKMSRYTLNIDMGLIWLFNSSQNICSIAERLEDIFRDDASIWLHLKCPDVCLRWPSGICYAALSDNVGQKLEDVHIIREQS